jgi:cation diffusion facilitator family transporter
MDDAYQKKAINIASFLSIFLNSLVIIPKFIAGILTGSVALITDGVHSLSDVFTDVVIYIALRFSIKSPDKDHPYGHGKIENLVAVIVGVLLIQVGGFFVYDGIKSFIADEIVSPTSAWGLYVVIFSILIKEFLFHITKYYGRKIKSDALIANAWHHRSDAFSSVVALIGIGASLLGFKYGDLIASVIIAAILVTIGIQIIVRNGNILIEASVSDDILGNIRNIAINTQGVNDYTHLKMRWVGKKIHGVMNITVDGEISVRDGHKIAHKLKQELTDNIKDLGSIIIHIDPSKK